MAGLLDSQTEANVAHLLTYAAPLGYGTPHSLYLEEDEGKVDNERMERGQVESKTQTR